VIVHVHEPLLLLYPFMFEEEHDDDDGEAHIFGWERKKKNNPLRWNDRFEMHRSTDWMPLDMSEVIANWNKQLNQPDIAASRKIRDGRMFSRNIEIEDVDQVVQMMGIKGVPAERVRKAFERHINIDWKAFLRKLLLWKDAAGFVLVVFRPHDQFKYVPDCPHPALCQFEVRFNSMGQFDVRARAVMSSLQADLERKADLFKTNEQFMSREFMIREDDRVCKQLLQDTMDKSPSASRTKVEAAVASLKKKKNKRKAEEATGEEKAEKKEKLEELPPPKEHYPDDETMVPMEQILRAQDSSLKFNQVWMYVFDEPTFQPLDGSSALPIPGATGPLPGLTPCRLVPTTVIQTIRLALIWFEEMERLRMQSARRALETRAIVESAVDKEAKALMNEGGGALSDEHSDLVKDSVLSRLGTAQGDDGSAGPPISKLNAMKSAAANAMMAPMVLADVQADLAQLLMKHRIDLGSTGSAGSKIDITRLGSGEKPYFAPFNDPFGDFMEMKQATTSFVCKLMGVPDQLSSHAEVGRNTKTRSSGPDDTTERVFMDTVCQTVFAVKDVLEDILSMIWSVEMGEQVAREIDQAVTDGVDGADTWQAEQIGRYANRITIFFMGLAEPALLQHLLDIGMIDEYEYARLQSAAFLFPKTLLRESPQIPLFTSQGFPQGLMEMQMEAERAAFDAAIEPIPTGGGGSGGQKKKTGGSGKTGSSGPKAMKRGKPPATGMLGTKLIGHVLGPQNKARMQQSAMNRTKKDLKNAPSAR
jgi:hypothetical protein